MGTNLPNDYLTTLKNYSKIIIALDRYASKKAVELTKHIRLVVPASLTFLEKALSNCPVKLCGVIPMVLHYMYIAEPCKMLPGSVLSIDN